MDHQLTLYTVAHSEQLLPSLEPTPRSQIECAKTVTQVIRNLGLSTDLRDTL